MKSTIEAMKQARDCIEAYRTGCGINAVAVLKLTADLTKSIASEEVKSVEPVGQVDCDDCCSHPNVGTLAHLTTPLETGTLIFTHPASATPTLPAERAALIESHRWLSEYGVNTDVKTLARKTSDMLAADAQEIEELESDYTDQVLRAITAEDALKAQQVAVPQVSVGYLAMDGYFIADQRYVMEFGEVPRAKPLYLTAPQPPQAAPRQEVELSDGEIYSRMSKAIDARLNVRVPMTDEQIDKVIPAASAYGSHCEAPWSSITMRLMRAVARSVEAHHGIVEVKP